MTVKVQDGIERSSVALDKIMDAALKMGKGSECEPSRSELAYLLYVAIDDECKRQETVDIEGFSRKLETLSNLAQKGLAGESNNVRKQEDQEADTTTKKLYGRAWSVFDKEAFVSAAGLLEERFKLSELDLEFIKGADCLDFGCGSGRYCFALSKLGARSVHGVDFSPDNIKLAKQRVGDLTDSKDIYLEEGDITKIFTDIKDKYDFVIAQGIIQCMENPFKALTILHNILKSGGRIYLFMYGSTGKGLYWKLVDVVRELLSPVSIERAQELFNKLGVKQNHIYAILDLGYVPIQHRFKRMDIEKTFKDIGLEIIKTMKRGKIYETNERVFRYPQEGPFWGNEELRYLLGKVV